MTEEVNNDLAATDETPSPVSQSHVGFDSTVIKSQIPGWVKVAGIVSLLLSVIVYYLRLDKVVGLMGDDSWYVMLAKAIATGQGYSLINSPTPGILPLYPPGFPLLLSFVFRISPNFPDNLWLLKSVSIVAMILVGIMAYRYFLNDRHLPPGIALGIAVATTFCPPLVFLAVSSVMSDCIFMFFFFATVMAAEKCVKVRNTSGEWKYALLAAALASYTFLTRSIAIALIAAVVVYFLKERLVRSAIIAALAAAVFIGPWMIYTRIHTPTPEQQLEQGGNMVLPYGDQFWQRLAGDSESGTITARELPARVVNNTLEVFGRDVARILTTLIFERLRDPYKEAQKLFSQGREGVNKHGDIIWFSLVLSIFVIIGFARAALEKLTFAEIALPMLVGVIVLWPFETVRYILPLAPFVVFYFLNGLHAVQQFIQRRSGKPVGQGGWALAYAALVLVIGMHLYGNLGSYLQSSGSSLQGSQWVNKYDEIEAAIRRLDQVSSKSEVIVSTNPALVYLLTDHKTISWDEPARRWELWKKLPVSHMAWLIVYPQPPSPAESAYKTVYMSRDGSYFRILDLGPVETRAPWQTGAPANPNEK